MAANDRIEAERAADRKADLWAVVAVFCALVAGAVHYISGWTF